MLFQHQFQGQSSEGAGISLVTDYASNFDAVELAEHHRHEALRLGVIKEDHEEEERMSPPAALQLLFQKQPDDIKPEKLQWSSYTQEQAQRVGRIGGPIGGRASVERNGEQMRNGGLAGGPASFAAQSKAAPTDTTFVMADGITKPNNQWQETSSKGGLIGGPATAVANAQRRRKRNEDDQGAYTTEDLEGGNTQYAIDLGLGVPKKPKYDLLELGKQMDDAIRRECFKEGTICFPVRKKRKAIVALSMDFVVKNKWFCTVWKQRVKSWPGGW